MLPHDGYLRASTPSDSRGAVSMRLLFSDGAMIFPMICGSYGYRPRILILCLALTAWGCAPEPIVSYTVEKLSPGVEATPAGTEPSGGNSAGQTTRILAAIARLPDVTWTVKTTGDPQAIAEIEPQWQAFLRSLKFSGSAEPTFELPDGWRHSGRTAQFRDIIVDIETVTPRLEVIFTRMPGDFDLTANVNRWRAGQLGLAPIAADDLPNHLRELAVGEAKLLLFDATGTAAANGARGMLPPAESTANPPAGTSQKPDHPSSAAAEIRFDPPADWQAGPTNPIVAGKFTKVVGEASLELSIVALRADSPWEQTVAIWSEGLGLPALTAEEIAQRTESRELAGVPARLIEFTSADGKQTTRVASVVRQANNWIIKLTGDAQLLVGEQATWEAFLQSIRFETAEQLP